MSRKTTAVPKSDETARHKQAPSQKTGKHSSVEKLAASRPEFAESPGAHPKPGASGDDGKEHEPTPEGTNAHRDKALRPKP
jgi:hypothetical protein